MRERAKKKKKMTTGTGVGRRENTKLLKEGELVGNRETEKISHSRLTEEEGTSRKT